MIIGNSMKRLIYQVYVGKRSKLYDHCTASVKKYADQIGADYHVQTTPILMIKPDPFQTNRSKESYEKYGGYLPIYEKEVAFAYLKNYDQIAVIDADVWVRPNSPNIFDELTDEYDFGAVVEREMPITEKYRNKILNYSKMQYSSIRNVDWKWTNDSGAEFFNMGVMLLNKKIEKYLNGETPRQFLNRPKFKSFVDGLGPWKWSTDQTLLNTWVKEEKMKAKNLDWRYNGLYTANTKIKECHFVHFFLKDLLPEKGENIEELMKVI
jgi:lipopolysaccharide biosynthesis glycosyltransferase